ncbi:scavenger receptor cysteine-rich domain-containing group B protein-like [Asterias amurensis]|uniref:scavenger receptor cysteine-rich domain-containing group B protein-like n=1 Tax=Asterias amurensis TaxID=7602 RepID=UPI003AB30496
MMSTVANSMLLLDALLIGLSLAHPISSVETREPYSTGPLCASEPLGMESEEIPDESITASSYLSVYWLPKYARLNIENGGSNFWIPNPVADSWIQVDLGLPGPVVTGLIVQGHTSQYVATFSVQYSDDGSAESWTYLVDTEGDTIHFNGNVNGGEQRTVNFPEVLQTRFLRILPLTWTLTPHLDFEVLGCRDGIVRLVGGDDASSGRVEIYHDDGWGAVCDTNWDFKDATTVCRQLGFLEASEAKIGSYFGATELPIVMDRVACKGTESYLSDCAFVCRDGNQTCNSTAGVVCKPNTIRLVGGGNKTSGRVELFKKDTWGTICDTEWDIIDAGVVCRQLGFSGATEAKTGSYFGEPEGPMYMQGVTCDGSEAKITDCPSHCWDAPKCNSTETAGVVCHNGNMETEIGEIPALQ